MSTKTKKTTKTKTTEAAKTRKPAKAEPSAALPASAATGAKKAAKKRRTAEPTEPKKLSALDAAAQLLKGSEPMNAKEMIEAMSAKGLWTSPGGETPHATLYSAILREINAKGDESRFVKADRGKFAAK